MILEKRKEINININEVNKLAKEFNLDLEVVKLMFFRGVNTRKKIFKFLNPDVDNFYDPFLLKNMKAVVEKIEKAILNKKRFLIFGDYDVDGISATAILYLYLKSKNCSVSYYLPNRYKDGYGLTIPVIDKINKKYNPDLIITVDCGITAVEEAEHIKNLGIDVIITDHHEVPEKTPDCLIINAKIKEQDYPFSDLCGAGVALKIVQALAGVKESEKYFDIAGIATIADIVSLQDENRLIVQLGLKSIQKYTRTGLKILLDELKLKSDLSSVEIAFKVAPKINAAGRMGDAGKGLELFIKKDKRILFNVVKTLLDLNVQRQQLCQKVYIEAIEQLKVVNMTKQKIIILSGKNWDSGLLGITAARLVDEFNRPTILFSEVDGKYKGSARSIEGINIHEALSLLTVKLDAFGGHTMAAGLTVDESNFEVFKEQLTACIDKKFDASYFYPKKYYDLDIKPEAINLKFIKALNLLAPFGHRNALPIFNLEFTNAKLNVMKKFPEHLTINFNNNFSLLNFNGSNNLPNFEYYKTKNALIELQLNKFRGKESAKGIVKQITFDNINLVKVKTLIEGHYLKQQVYETKNKAEFKTYKVNEFKEFIKNKFVSNKLGNLIIFSSVESYNKNVNLIKELNLQSSLFEINNKLGLNGFVLGLNNIKNLNSYNNIIFADSVLNNGFIAELNNYTNAQIFVPEVIKKPEFKITGNRDEFAKYFNVFKDAVYKKVNANNLYDFYYKVKKLNPHIKNFNYVQFTLCLEVFKQLQFIEEEITATSYKIKLNKTTKSELTNSKIYNYFSKY